VKPRLLDLFCGAGGASMGYHRAGFDVVGVDVMPQPHYPFAFVLDNALAVTEWDGFDAVHASPPCQHFSGAGTFRDYHPNHIWATRVMLFKAELPYVIENIPGAERHLIDPTRFCGSQFGLRIRRHRYFETNWALSGVSVGCSHRHDDLPFKHEAEREYADAMGCEWMPAQVARQAVPPAYTELIGRRLLEILRPGAVDDGQAVAT
jgi:DNA (cytosine-5)-methyltransferase 1